jgi:hypothetical protein
VAICSNVGESSVDGTVDGLPVARSVEAFSLLHSGSASTPQAQIARRAGRGRVSSETE